MTARSIFTVTGDTAHEPNRDMTSFCLHHNPSVGTPTLVHSATTRCPQLCSCRFPTRKTRKSCSSKTRARRMSLEKVPWHLKLCQARALTESGATKSGARSDALDIRQRTLHRQQR
jgi:hypothetical protein